MRVYQMDRDGWYVGPVEADPSPLEPGVFLIPGGCVLDPPATFDPLTELPRRIDGQWIVFPRAIDPEAEPAPEPEPDP